MSLESLFTSESIFLISLMISAGAIAGILAGLLGVGGGIITVPVLYQTLLFYGIDPSLCMHLSVGTSLCLIVTTGLSSARSHYKRGSVSIHVLRTWSIWVVIGVLIGGFLARISQGPVLSLTFSVVATVSAIHLLRPQKKSLIAEPSLPAAPWRQVLPVLIGGASTMMGIGGGAMTVPLLSARGYKAQMAIGTSSAMGLFIAVPGAVLFVLNGLDNSQLPTGAFGYVFIPALLIMLPISTICAPVGARLAHAIDGQVLKRGFAIFLLLMAARMAYATLQNWSG